MSEEMGLFEVMYNCRAMRRLDTKPVPEELLVKLIDAVRSASETEPIIGKKLPGTSARFAPDGQGIVWGQSGSGPHARDERHYIPSIINYYRALDAYAKNLVEIVQR